jgi:hypothetical protein
MKLLRIPKKNRLVFVVLIGDIAVYLLATILGFISHSGETNPTIGRMAATFIPFLLAWILIAPWFGAYDRVKLSDSKSVWRSTLASLYAAPIGAFGRSLILNSPILPLFVIIMGGATAGLMIVWRFLLTRIIPNPQT